MFIKSKLTCSVWVTKYAPLQEGRTSRTLLKKVLVKGGANTQDRKTLVTPDGIIQEIPDEEWEAIKDEPWVRAQIEAGFIAPYTSRPKEKFSDMAKKDGSAQLTEDDYRKNGRKAPRAVKGGDAEDI